MMNKNRCFLWPTITQKEHMVRYKRHLVKAQLSRESSMYVAASIHWVYSNGFNEDILPKLRA